MGKSEEGEYMLHVQACGLYSIDHFETGDELCGFRASLVYNQKD
jgi:hypothetical protein